MKNRTFLRCLVGVGGIVAALVLAGGPLSASTKPTSADGRGETPIAADDQPTVLARSDATRSALGLPGGVAETAVHVTEPSNQLQYDEVTSYDVNGRPVSLTGLDASGRLVIAVRFDVPVAVENPVGAEAAAEIAAEGLSAVAVSTNGPPVVEPSVALGGWDLHWRRLVNGVPVRGDEILVHVRDDGQIGSVGQVVHSLAPAPLVKLTSPQARALATKQIQAWSAKSGVSFSITGMAMQWVDPNAAFDPARIGAPAQPYRLAWVVTIAPQGSATAYASLVVLYLDAGDGSVVGGDMVE
jgi:hypothetical protein